MIDLDAPDLQCAYLPFEKYDESSGRSQHKLLGAVYFSSVPNQAAAAPADAAFAHVPMPTLEMAGGLGSTCEVWRADGEFHYGRHNELRFGHNQDVLFGVVQLSEAAFDANHHTTPLQLAAESAYQAIFDLTDKLKFPNILRFWNYLPDINGKSRGLERYRQFNAGRQDGFLERGRTVIGSAVPAASAVGCGAGPLTVCFLAGRGRMPAAIENPRQVSAYHYPSDYGPRSPTFSRASVARVGNDDVLFISGTASIVGHRTLHPGDVVAQTRETITNLSALVAEANRVAPWARFAPGDLCCKVYVRHEKDVIAVHDELRRGLGESARLVFLRADICRPDLLMEVEATASHPFSVAPCG